MLGPIYIGFGVISVGLLIWFYISYFTKKGSNDNWDVIKQNFATLWIVPVIAIVCLFITCMYVSNLTPDDGVLFMLFLSCLTVSLSIGAVQIAIISR